MRPLLVPPALFARISVAPGRSHRGGRTRTAGRTRGAPGVPGAKLRSAAGRLVALAALSLWLSSTREARAQAGQDLSGVETIVTVRGDCLGFKVSGASYGCTALLYLRWRRGRVGYLLRTKDGGSLLISGGRDSQLTPERYVLDVDRVAIVLSQDARAQAYPASGRCTTELSTDGRLFYAVRCDISNGAETVLLEFKGDDTPVTVKHFR